MTLRAWLKAAEEEPHDYMTAVMFLALGILPAVLGA
jgi:hypothetical protein